MSPIYNDSSITSTMCRKYMIDHHGSKPKSRGTAINVTQRYLLSSLDVSPSIRSLLGGEHRISFEIGYSVSHHGIGQVQLQCLVVYNSS